MENFGISMIGLICGLLGAFLLFASVGYFRAPVVVQTEPVVLRVKLGWTSKIEPGYYRLGERMEKKIIYDKQIIEEAD